MTPLSYFGKSNITFINNGKNKQINAISYQTSTKDQVNNMDAATYFTTMVTAMYNDPPYSSIEDSKTNESLSILGLVPSESFDFYSLSPEVQESLKYAVEIGPKLIETDGIKTLKYNSINGWSIIIKDIGNYGRHYKRRAIAAMFVLGANIPQDAVYGISYVDNDGKTLGGSNNYIIHFNKKQIPPVKAFWSITLYNSQGFLVENPIDRYAISSHIGKLNYNTDGSLDIYIQNTLAGDKKELNWLPAPIGSFNLMLRMYWPKQRVLSGEYKLPAVMRR